MLNYKNIAIVQDMDMALVVMKNVGIWLEENGKNPSKWWKPENMNRSFMLRHAQPQEFFAALVDNKSAAAMILQDNQRNQSWKSVDREKLMKIYEDLEFLLVGIDRAKDRKTAFFQREV